MSIRHLIAGLGLAALLAPATVAAESGEVIFQDAFNGKLGEGWAWIREEPTNWRVGPGGLEVRVQPGNMWGGANNARNVLTRPVPVPSGAPIEISVTFSNTPTARWEQSNLVWFYDDSNMVKLGQELVADRLTIVMGREEGDRARTIAIIPLDDFTVELRLQAVDNRVRGQFRTRYWQEWRDVGECDLPVKGEPKASLHFYNGSAAMEHWSKASRFTVRRLQPEAANWPRARAEEKNFRSAGGDLPAREPEKISLGGEFTLVNGLEGVIRPGANANFDQGIFRHTDGSFGWSWDRRASASKEPNRPGVEFRAKEFSLPVAGLKSFAVELDAVARLNIDRPDHSVALAVALATGLAADAPTTQLVLWFDWYGKDWTAPALSDGQRDYAHDAAASGTGRQLYRLQGLRGVPPKVNLKPLLDDAIKRAKLNPAQARVQSVWLGNEVWNGSCGATLVTRLDLIVNDARHAAVAAGAKAP